jgi:PAS domain S-box-containing protein
MPFSEVEIFHAIEQNQFIPHFQPLVDLREGSIRGFEVLARWQHPTQGLIAPNQFIPVVEHCGLMNRLSILLFKRAFAEASVVPANIGLSVNISPAQLHDRGLADMLQCLADAAHFDLKRLTVEITESALLDDLELAALIAADLKSRGVRLSLDDFGTGYSSLLHLQALPFDELKVDMSFVRSMVTSRQSRKITAAVISLGSSLGLETVGEGIEDLSQANLLLWQGCTIGQGWFYGHPVPAEQLADVLAQPLPQTSAGPLSASITDMSLSLEGRPSERLSQLQAIYDSAPVGLCFLNRELRYVNVNQRLAAMNGTTVRAMLGRKVADVVPVLYAQSEKYLKRALLGEGHSGGELYVPASRADDVATTRLVSYQPVRDETGEVLGVCVSVLDNSAFRRDEEVLYKSAEYHRSGAECGVQGSDVALRSIPSRAEWHHRRLSDLAKMHGNVECIEDYKRMA